MFLDNCIGAQEMARISSLIIITPLLFACSHANIGSVPTIIDGEEVFTYQGRANFGHQLKLADKMMIDHCADLNRGNPVIIDRKDQDLGYVVTGSSSSVNAMENHNQIIQFICRP